MRIPILAALFLVPTLTIPGLFVYFDTTPKVMILLFCVAAMLCCCKENVKTTRLLLSHKLGRWLAGLLVLQLLATFGASLASTNRALSFNGSSWRRWGWITDAALVAFAFLSTGWMAADRQRIRTVLRVSCLAGTLGAIYGVVQYFGWDPVIPASNYQVGKGAFMIVRPPGSIGHADYFASWLLIVAFFALALLRIEVNKAIRAACATTAALCSVAILLTGTRAAMLGFLVALLALFCMQGFRIPRAWPVICVLVFSIGVLFVSPPGAKLRARLKWSIEDARGGARVLLWRDSLRMASHRPLTGFGPETFSTIFPRYTSVSLARVYPDFYQESPHNMFLDVLTASGIFAFLILAMLIALAFASGWLALRSRNALAAPLVAGLTGIIVAQQFSVMIVTSALYFYLMMSLLIVTAIRPAAYTKQPIAVRLLIPVNLFTAALFVIFALRLAVADRDMARAEHLTQLGDASSAATAYHAALQWQPEGSGSDLAYSRAMAGLANRSPIFLVRLQAWQQAMESGVRSTKTTEDRQNAWYNLAMLFAAQNDSASVERCLRNAIEYAPHWFKPHWTLARLLLLTGRHEEARKEAAAAVECDGGHDAEVSDTWKAIAMP